MAALTQTEKAARPVTYRPATRTSEAAVSAYPTWLARELRSDHAGETGAVAIYRGILAVSRDAEVRDFARHHLQTESRHLELMRELVPPELRSRLLPLWYLAGFTVGALPAVFGRSAIYATIAAVETFVDDHYGQQISRLEGEADWGGFRETLVACRADEVAHRDEARRGISGDPGFALRLWLAAVANGSAWGVALARRL